jgi:hypothetical protein
MTLARTWTVLHRIASAVVQWFPRAILLLVTIDGCEGPDGR